ncbi:DUF6414 family protein [Kitasatospora aureofaciens]|uniref:DUF6414 family protein n=1 Tax=Kitasatospora aureofaciens TaxID=1894 RepID=UPI0036F48365
MPIPTLPRFIYLDEKSLGEYLSVVEDGISDEAKRRRLQSEEELSGPGGRGTEEEEKVIRETASQRFIRFLAALDGDPARWRYRDVEDISRNFDAFGISDFIHLNVEIEIPPAVQLFSQPDQLSSMLDMMEALRPMAPLLGKSFDDMPGEHETKAVRELGRVVKSDVVIVGDQDDDSPKITGKLTRDYIRDAIEGEVFVLGKVIRKWGPSESHSLLALPGASLMSRQQRRQAASQLSNDDGTRLEGPAVTLDILAIYR